MVGMVSAPPPVIALESNEQGKEQAAPSLLLCYCAHCSSISLKGCESGEYHMRRTDGGAFITWKRKKYHT